jgi:uncharacterized protein (DUF934 family)
MRFMPLLKNNAFIKNTWQSLADDASIEDGARIIVSLARLQRDWDQLVRHTGLLGVTIGNAADEKLLAPYFSGLLLIVVNFPAFTDGRSYSQARQLRLDGFRGEIRATGNILPDQLQFMLQVGVDSFEVSDRFTLEDWQKAANMMGLTYQLGYNRAGGEREVWAQRHQNGEQAWEEQPHAG